MLVGNKSDLRHLRSVQPDEAEVRAVQCGSAAVARGNGDCLQAMQHASCARDTLLL